MIQTLASFVSQPEQLATVCFESQRANEHTKLLLRRHPITNLSWILTTIVLLILPLIIYYYQNPIWQFLSWESFIESLSRDEVLIFLALYYIAVKFYAFLKFLEWYFDAMVVTESRVIDIYYEPPFNRQTTQAQLEEIQDIRHTQNGIFASLFDYGNLYIQTAGEQQTILLKRVPHPAKVHDLIIHLLP
jgi:hypothetical protein